MRFAHAVVAIVATLALAGRVGAVPLAGEWTALAGDPLHNGIADAGPDSFDTELFVTPFSGFRNLVAHSSVVVAEAMLDKSDQLGTSSAVLIAK